jgi:hypothetical protein
MKGHRPLGGILRVSFIHARSQVIGHILGEWFTNMLAPDWQLMKKSGM